MSSPAPRRPKRTAGEDTRAPLRTGGCLIIASVPQSVHEHAYDNLRFIRETMERAGSFTSIPGWGGVAIGVTAVITAAVAQGRTPRSWLMIWLADAVVAALIGAVAIVLKARRAGVSLSSGATKKFFASYFAPIVCGAVLTYVSASRGFYALLPALWLLDYGASFVSSGAFSIRMVPFMGLAFMALGLIAAFTPLPIGNLLLGTGFGGLHIVFGYIIARNYGG